MQNKKNHVPVNLVYEFEDNVIGSKGVMNLITGHVSGGDVIDQLPDLIRKYLYIDGDEGVQYPLDVDCMTSLALLGRARRVTEYMTLGAEPKFRTKLELTDLEEPVLCVKTGEVELPDDIASRSSFAERMNEVSAQAILSAALSRYLYCSEGRDPQSLYDAILYEDKAAIDALKICPRTQFEGMSFDEVSRSVGESMDMMRKATSEIAREASSIIHSTRPRVLVVVNGGVADYLCDEGVDVAIFDYDNYRAGAQYELPQRFDGLAKKALLPFGEQDQPKKKHGFRC